VLCGTKIKHDYQDRAVGLNSTVDEPIEALSPMEEPPPSTSSGSEHKATALNGKS
jgi:hypothetical protein